MIAKRFRVLMEMEPDGIEDASAVVRLLRAAIGSASRVEVVAESPEPGVQAAFIYGATGSLPCHAVVKKKDGPWSVNRVGFCGTEPQSGPVGSIDRPEGGLCRECEKYVRKGDDGLWYIRDNAPLPRQPVPRAAECDCADDD